ncbi:MAG: six-cysteine peptide SCIFF [Clostridia bacterium]|nr:six-cysteine peptide SCIFF [Clostridia bacterium]
MSKENECNCKCNSVGCTGKCRHVKTLKAGDLEASMKTGGCGECQTSCQSACKTSCTVGNQSCEHA